MDMKKINKKQNISATKRAFETGQKNKKKKAIKKI